MSYGYTDDNVSRMSYISKDKILHYVSEEEIFELVFGYQPEEFQYVSSPFREDNKPGCWFERRGDTLRFIDFAGKSKFFPDCFDAVKRFYGLPNFYKTMDFIYQKLIKGKDLTPREQTQTQANKQERASILIQSRGFIQQDAEFWSPYGVSRENLMADKVFPVSRYVLTNPRGEKKDTRVKQLCYAYTDFPDQRKKLYLPSSIGVKFINSCFVNDIGGISQLPFCGTQLIITKSYKDYRVIKNLGRNVVWFQSERSHPDKKVLRDLVKRFTKVVILYDNDRAGIEGAMELANIVNSMFPGRARPIWLPEHLQGEGITDSADLRKDHGEKALVDFFTSLMI